MNLVALHCSWFQEIAENDWGFLLLPVAMPGGQVRTLEASGNTNGYRHLSHDPERASKVTQMIDLACWSVSAQISPGTPVIQPEVFSCFHRSLHQILGWYFLPAIHC
jgi:hypothetical protein